MRRSICCSMLVVLANLSAAANVPIEQIQLPAGFHIEVVARVANARQMALGDNNVLYVGSMTEGKVVAVQLDKSYIAGQQYVIASGLTLPIGVAYRDGNLYVSAVSRILRYDQIGQHLSKPPAAVVIRDDLPKENHHGGRYIGFGPDGYLYVPIGAPCNICEPEPDRYAAILRMKPDGSALTTFARGIRNTVGFDWQPASKQLWFTDNGRDLLGDDVPSDELNRATAAGMHFGYPYCHAGSVSDPEFGAKHPCSKFTAPVQNLGAHVASLGMRFYTGAQFPAAYRNHIFIAEHGSWNRSRKSGYRISVVQVENGKAVSYKPFATGWLQGDSVWGRPVDLLNLPDGSLLVSDDFADAIYRIRYAP
ncbi:MAG: PQQ-dependent sugar dehydrogenase [Pseudomonadota bacterium]